MTKKQELKWRLAKLPTPDEVRELVKDKIITQEEARDILFSSEHQEEKDVESLKAEVKFLKEIIENLSHNHGFTKVVEIIEKPYYRQWPWYGTSINWLCSTGGSSLTNCINGTTTEASYIGTTLTNNSIG